MGRKKSEVSDELDPVTQRLLDFVNNEENGGPSKVAAKLGKHPQLFYNMQKGASKPSMDTLREIKGAYDSFDLNWIIMGSPTAEMPVDEQGAVPEANLVDMLRSDVQALLDEKDKRITELQTELKETKTELKTANGTIAELAKLSFNEPSGQITASKQMPVYTAPTSTNPIGFEIGVNQISKTGPLNILAQLGFVEMGSQMVLAVNHVLTLAGK